MSRLGLNGHKLYSIYVQPKRGCHDHRNHLQPSPSATEGADVAMVATDQVDGLIATAHLLRSDKNAQRLLAALSRARDKDIAPSTLTQLTKMVGSDA